jgi:hypothetical protein
MKKKTNKMFRVYYDDGLISYALDERFNSEKSAWDFIKSSTYVDGLLCRRIKIPTYRSSLIKLRVV